MLETITTPIAIDFDQTNPGLITFGTILDGDVEFMIHEYGPTDINVEFTKEHADHENIDHDDPAGLLLQIENVYRAQRGYELIEE